MPTPNNMLYASPNFISLGYWMRETMWLKYLGAPMKGPRCRFTPPLSYIRGNEAANETPIATTIASSIAPRIFLRCIPTGSVALNPCRTLGINIPPQSRIMTR